MSRTIKEKKSIQELYDKLTQGDIHSSLKVYETYAKTFDNSEFIERIFKPVMNTIENDFVNEKINTATEHVAKNVAQTLVKIIADRENKDD